MPLPIIYVYDKKGERIRVRRTIDYLKQCSPPFLDVGCGSKVILKAVNAVTVDVDKCKRPDVVATVCHLPFKDGYCETVSAFEVIEHVENDVLACVCEKKTPYEFRS